MGRPASKPNTRLARILKKLGMTQAGLADKQGVRRQAVFRWCAFGVPAERTQRVAKYLGVAPKELRPDLFRG